MSRVGLKPISLPDKVAVKLDGRKVIVEGPKGKLDFSLPEGITLTSADGTVVARFASEVASSAIVAKTGSFVRYQQID